MNHIKAIDDIKTKKTKSGREVERAKITEENKDLLRRMAEYKSNLLELRDRRAS
jgi:hypothetical protein